MIDGRRGWWVEQRKREITTDEPFIRIFECADALSGVTIPPSRDSDIPF